MIRLASLIGLLALGLAVSPSVHPQSLSIEGAAAGHAISKAAADAFTKQNRTTRILLGLSGNAAGFAKFCAAMLDILNASRPIQKEELEACAKAKTEFVEVPIAFDAVTVIVNPRNRFIESLSVYRIPGQKAEYELMSYGRDGKAGGEGEAADITNWR